jgi:hypothetical protein
VRRDWSRLKITYYQVWRVWCLAYTARPCPSAPYVPVVEHIALSNVYVLDTLAKNRYLLHCQQETIDQICFLECLRLPRPIPSNPTPKQSACRTGIRSNCLYVHCVTIPTRTKKWPAASVEKICGSAAVKRVDSQSWYFGSDRMLYLRHVDLDNNLSTYSQRHFRLDT